MAKTCANCGARLESGQAVCPRCGWRADIMSYRYDWDQDETMAQLKCKQCGRSEVPFLESRIEDVDIIHPLLKKNQYRVLLPFEKDQNTVRVIWEFMTAKWNKA